VPYLNSIRIEYADIDGPIEFLEFDYDELRKLMKLNKSGNFIENALRSIWLERYAGIILT
jgi:hypothetical protein